MGDACLCGFCEPHVAVDAAAGVPAGAFRLVVQADFYPVASSLDEVRELHGPGGVAVGPAAGLSAVHVHSGIGKCAVNFQADVFLKVFFTYFQGFCIPSLAPPGKLAGFSGVFLLERSFYSPVVREVENAFRAVFGE